MTREEYNSFVREQQEPLRRFLLNLSGGDRYLADEVAEEAFVKAYVSLGSFRGRCKLSTWLFRIAYNCFYDHVRRQGREVKLDTARDIETEDPVQRGERREILQRALMQLSVPQRDVTLLFYMEDKSIREISGITGMNGNTVKSHLRRAKQTMKTYLSKM
ncbi:MAG: RNA polymerase sigma factor [Bacteroidales bacterium]|jgi:RNA polymerase sigma-70 factor (ECF subfamily)|nr:RNA polymerase sigma factor [Bacteroidales bacterium]MCI2122117.1 RNA polymerase sigma factor [Bacteroidales bacterium]MCI2145628.1 RNA polymerase sigma factor [Bacteroidales bacterium]